MLLIVPVMAVLFGALPISLSILEIHARASVRASRVRGMPAGMIFWGRGMVMACVEAGIDTPFEKNPFYLLVGMSIAPGP